MFKMTNKQKSFDRVIINLSIGYIIAPIIVFIFGWIRIIYAVPIVGILIYLLIKALKRIQLKEYVFNNTCSVKKYLLCILFISVIWVYLSGIGGYVFQNGDYWARNPMYRDLCDYDWPVIFDLNNQEQWVQEVTGTGKVAFVYYFSWWLVPALIVKVFCLGEFARNIILFIYACFGVFLAICCTSRIVKKTSYFIPVGFVLFSGLDVLGCFLKSLQFPEIGSHIEWWSGFFQFSSNTTLLFWVFNQAIPIWIVTSLFIQLDDEICVAISAISFAYSPWATMGLIPIVVSRFIKNRNKIRNYCSLLNVFTVTIIAFIYGMFYSCGNGSAGENGFIFLLADKKSQVLMSYLLFVFLEFFVFYIAMGKKAFREDYSKVIILEVILFPLFRIIQYSWLIRGIIPAFYILTIIIMKYILQETSDLSINKRKQILCILLVIGTITPIYEILRTVSITLNQGAVINDMVYSFGHIRREGATVLEELKSLYFKYDYTNSIFFKYLSR